MKFQAGANASVLKIIGDPPPGHHPGMVSAAALPTSAFVSQLLKQW
jgi:hypothetical protein